MSSGSVCDVLNFISTEADLVSTQSATNLFLIAVTQKLTGSKLIARREATFYTKIITVLPFIQSLICSNQFYNIIIYSIWKEKLYY